MSFSNQYQILSFDLDNALYDNQPVISRAEEESRLYLEQAFDQESKTFEFEKFLSIRHRLMESKIKAYENLSRMRLVALAEFCDELANKEEVVQQAFDIFIHYRSKVKILPEISELLSELSQQFTLVTASNGNCDISRSPIGKYFDSFWSATMDIRAKPHPEILQRILSHYKVPKESLMHIGDSEEKDGGSADNAGVDYFRLAPFEGGKFNPSSIESLKSVLLGK